jgi:hypothetical protein
MQYIHTSHAIFPRLISHGDIFFLEHAGELRVIILREKKGPKWTKKTKCPRRQQTRRGGQKRKEKKKEKNKNKRN